MLHGAGNAHIGKPPFLFEPTGRIQAHHMREQFFFCTNQKDSWEFKTLGGMQRHQLHRIRIWISLCLTGVQTRLREELQ